MHMRLARRSLLALLKPVVAVWYATCSSLPLLVAGSSPTGLHEHQAHFLATAKTGSKSDVLSNKDTIAVQHHEQAWPWSQNTASPDKPKKPVEPANITMKYDGIDPHSMVHHNTKTMTSDWQKEVPGYKGFNSSDGSKSGAVLLRPAVKVIATLVTVAILGQI
mmetsp:Transcript_51300/g.101881  ORF Transcript_51300/g.101881 Transcript_51300/m.101881 type:complete len:163 (+) Transcript_51300:38-526(+)